MNRISYSNLCVHTCNKHAGNLQRLVEMVLVIIST